MILKTAITAACLVFLALTAAAHETKCEPGDMLWPQEIYKIDEGKFKIKVKTICINGLAFVATSKGSIDQVWTVLRDEKGTVKMPVPMTCCE